ncbi:hypothetical protein C2U72_21005 [Prosthecomicrobium hirschii]|uniref:Uma2 family endonuclease n=1 Tax=Prosthecodimorpha hirschii TaxID=665126 RepID=UPI001126B904|nr:Uma2 family endonuclease [Prosthecomicrobium hirschii]TPQ48963.1 hypothetical protein C2U72_21005 [Prosthecomicrobium hirschii]
MNARTLIAADGLPRRAFTVAEVEAMVRAGILAEDERIELIDGELIPMSPKGSRHETVKIALNLHWSRLCPDDRLVAQGTTVRLSPDSYLEPDFVIFPFAAGVDGLGPETALLAVEIADSSLGYDLGRKAAVYARFGIAELWVVEAWTLAVHVHTEPTPDGYRSVAIHAADAMIVPTRAAAFALRPAALRLPA